MLIMVHICLILMCLGQYIFFFHERRQTYIEKKIDLTSRRMLMVGELFPNGGEVYSHNDLLNKIDESLGYNNSQAERLIKDCIKAGFLTQMDNQTYTR